MVNSKYVNRIKMDFNKVKDEFLRWEEKNQLYEIKINDFPIYAFIRTEVYISLIFKSDVASELKKTSPAANKKISYSKILYNSLIFFKKQNLLKKNNLFITNTDNRIKIGDRYADRFFDKIVTQKVKESSILEFPNLVNYHFANSYNSDLIVKADIFYVLEKIFKSKINREKINFAIGQIETLYSEIYEKVTGTTPKEGFKTEFRNRIERNLRRIYIYEKLIKHYKPQKIFLTSSYSPMKQIFIHTCKKYNVETIELQHGHIYSLHVGYLLALGSTAKFLTPDKVYVWSDYYKQILVENGWEKQKIKVVGDFTFNEELSSKNVFLDEGLKTTRASYETVITLVSQHTLNQEFANFLRNVEKLPKEVLVFIKLHPKYIDSQERIFSEIIRKNKNVILVKKDNIKVYLKISDLVVGVYSTGIIEAIEMNKTVHLIDIEMAQFFNELIEKKIVQKTNSIFDSYKLIKENKINRKIVFREKLNLDLA